MFDWLRRWVLRQGFKKVSKEVEMQGWKSKLAAAAAMLTGAGLVLNAIVEANYGNAVAGLLVIIGGLSVLGLGHKLDKLKDVLEKLR